MFGRTFLFLSLLTAAVIVPYLLSDDRWSAALRQPLQLLTHLTGGQAAWREGDPPYRSDGSSTTWPTATASTSSGGPHDWLGGSGVAAQGPGRLPGRAVEWPPVGGPPASSLADVVRLDATPPWILQNWARVSRVPSEEGLQVLRAPLLTGNQLDDVVGSITYYFDGSQQARRVVVEGHTGDPSRVVQTAQQSWSLVVDGALGWGVMVLREQQQLRHVLKVAPAPIVRSDQPQQRFELQLELNRPGAVASRSAHQWIGVARGASASADGDPASPP